MKKLDIACYIVSFFIILIVIIFGKNLKFFVVDSGSMQPTLEIGELVVVAKRNQYEVGDIITYYDKNFKGYITHRIEESTEDGKFKTKGDFNNVCDEKMVDTKEIVGKVIFHNKVLGLIFYKYKIITVILILSILILASVYSIIFKER